MAHHFRVNPLILLVAGGAFAMAAFNLKFYRDLMARHEEKVRAQELSVAPERSNDEE